MVLRQSHKICHHTNRHENKHTINADRAGAMSKLVALIISIPWRIREVCFVLYAALLTWLSLAPAEMVGKYSFHFPHADKLIHFCVYGGLVLLARFAFPDPRHLSIRPWIVPVMALAYGGVLDVLQGMLVQYHRTFEWGDVGANALGAIVFWFLASAVIGDKGPFREGEAPPGT